MWFPEFEPEAHRYFHPVTRKELPGVNRIIRQAGLVDASYFYEEIRRRGKFVHQMTALIDRDDLQTFDPQLAGWKQSYELFMATGIAEWDHDWTERPLAHQREFYCGTNDRWGWVHKRPANVELKCGSYVPWHEVQAVAYRRMRPMLKRTPWKSYLLYLHSNGRKATLRPCMMLDAEQRWIECYNLFHWRLRNGDRTCFEDRTEGQPIADFGSTDID